MSEELQDKLISYIEDTIDIRFKFAYPAFDSGPVELHSSLVDVQKALSEIEALLSKSMRAKSLLDRKVVSSRMVWQEVWDRAISKVNNRPRLSEYATGKEKAAEANLAAFNEARELHILEGVQSFAAEAVEVIRLHYYGLDKIRQDVRKRLDMSQTDYYS